MGIRVFMSFYAPTCPGAGPGDRMGKIPVQKKTIPGSWMEKCLYHNGNTSMEKEIFMIAFGPDVLNRKADRKAGMIHLREHNSVVRGFMGIPAGFQSGYQKILVSPQWGG